MEKLKIKVFIGNSDKNKASGFWSLPDELEEERIEKGGSRFSKTSRSLL